MLALIAGAGSFAALSFVFASPLIAAVILIEATAIGGARLRSCCFPGCSPPGSARWSRSGWGRSSGLSSRDYALGPLPLPHFGHPDIAQFGWTIALAIAVAVVVTTDHAGRAVHATVRGRATDVILLPIVGLIIAGLAIAFHGATGKSVNEVLFSGQDALPGLLRQAGTWSLGALALADRVQGPGLHAVARQLPRRPGVPGAVPRGGRRDHGLAPARVLFDPGGRRRDGRAIAAVLRLPLAAVVLATLLTANAGPGDEPLIIVGVVVSYLVTLRLSAPAARRVPGRRWRRRRADARLRSSTPSARLAAAPTDPEGRPTQ